jgi:hypothetical protein
VLALSPDLLNPDSLYAVAALAGENSMARLGLPSSLRKAGLSSCLLMRF